MSGNPTADNSSSVPIDSELAPRSRKLSQWFSGKRHNRPLLLLAAAIAIGVATPLALWLGDFFGEVEAEQAPKVSAHEIFAAECKAVRDQRLKILQLTECEVNDDMLTEITDMDWIDTLILDLGIVTDKGVESIAKIPRLQHLRLRLSPITDEGLKTISHCQSLWFVNLPHADCTSTGVKHLQNLKNLRQLRLGSKKLGNDVTGVIAEFEGLRGIHLIGVPVTDEGLETLAEMPYLESLYLDDAAVTEAGWDRLFRDHPDLHVHINQRHHDRDPKSHAHHD